MRCGTWLVMPSTRSWCCASMLSTWDPQACQNADRKSTRLNSSHLVISYAVFCLKKKTKLTITHSINQAITLLVHTSSPFQGQGPPTNRIHCFHSPYSRRFAAYLVCAHVIPHAP